MTSLQSLSRDFALDIQRLDRLKSKAAIGSAKYLHLCHEIHHAIMTFIQTLKPVAAKLAP
jgi:hypothetical protein